jgi:NADPH:quinone reductase-like Zn-dependent oxidoreductase/NAD(P)-dependent dehydrogenase (short-subunit alcohol dehydrogenase family)/aryl carrier-like protein
MKVGINIIADNESETQRRLASVLAAGCMNSQIMDHNDFMYKEGIIKSDRVFVSLLEFGTTHLSVLKEDGFQKLKNIIHHSQNLVWITSLPTTEQGANDPHSSVAMGLLRAIQSEAPEKNIFTLITQLDALEDSLRLILQALELFCSNIKDFKETELVMQNGCLTVGRLTKEIELNKELEPYVKSKVESGSLESSPPLHLKVGTPGLLDTLHFVQDPVPGTGLGGDEVEIEATAWPLSFRDMFVALGRMSLEHMGIECAGTITRLGAACPPDLKIGDEVVMVNPGCFRTHPRAPADLVYKVPAGFSLHETVAIWNPAMTAYHSLINVARLKPKDKVLIHSGSGSTGQMAIAIAKWIGAEVFTTVGFDHKKELLKERFNIPDDHIFYSRSPAFAKGIKRVTQGYGVDVVLNSLSGDLLRASWDCIAPFGRFVEIGKADIVANASLPMSCFAKNVSFSGVDLFHMLKTDIELITQLGADVTQLMVEGHITGPKPLHLYPMSQVEKAFRYLQGGTNTGRIILVKQPGDIISRSILKTRQALFSSNASYIVAGGFGGIGRAILRWMASNGARNLIVPSRSGPSSDAASALVAELQEMGVNVKAPRCNVGLSVDVSALVQECQNTMPPIKGCINAAMALQDSVFENMTHAQWSQTIQSKVDSSWNLHQLLPGDMDFFVLLSSMAGIYGSAGQSNYAAGCAFQDDLARYRSAAGQRSSVSINLGWMRTIGVIAENEKYRQHRKHAANMSQVEEADLFALLGHYCDTSLSPLSTNQGQVMIGVVTKNDFHSRGGSPPEVLSRPLFSTFDSSQIQLSPDSTGMNSGENEYALRFRKATTFADGSVIVVEALKMKLARAMDVSAEDIDTRRSLTDYGTDSLMAVEIRNWIRRDFGVAVSVFDIMNGVTIAAVGELIAKRAKT